MNIEEKTLNRVRFVVDEACLQRLEQIMKGQSPVEIEIGCGKAKFLIERAQRFPMTQFIALDRVGKWMNIGKKRAERRNLTNLLFIKAHAQELIQRSVPSERIDAFHIYFPDPWPKRRHHKRRLVTAELLSVLYDRLQPQGTVWLATDDLDYRNFMERSARTLGLGWTIRERINQRFSEEDSVKTNYEAKYQLAGKTLYYLEFCKP